MALTKDGRDLLEHARDGQDRDHRQTFHAGIRKPRELTHDVDVYRAYKRASSRIREDEGQVRCVVLDYEMKREYQQFLQEPNRNDEVSDGRPRRDEHEIRHWAGQHELPYFDDQVHFPDCRIEYEDRYGREQYHDIEVVTPHYRGGHAAATARTGFQCYRGAGLSGRNGGTGGRRGARGGLAEELLS